MSQVGQFLTGTSPTTTIDTITGNSGGAVSPDAAHNIDLIGAGTITVVGDPGMNTLMIQSTSGDPFLLSLTGDTGGPEVANASGNMDISGGANINTAGTLNTITINLDDNVVTNSYETSSATQSLHIESNAITAGGSNANVDITFTPKGSGKVEVVTGNLAIDAGNLVIPATNTAGTEGIVTVGGNRFLSTYTVSDGNIFMGINSGNTTLTGSNNIGIGREVLEPATTANANVAIGNYVLENATTAFGNTLIGHVCGQQMTTGESNVGMGEFALYIATSAHDNTCAGNSSLVNLLTGHDNNCFGGGSGDAYTGAESSNALFAASGVVGDNHVMRLGETGSGDGQVTTAYIAATYGVNVGSVATVMTMANTEQIGTATITAGTGITVTPGANTITISQAGVETYTYTAVSTTPYVVLSTDYYLGVDCSGGARTVQLPNAPSTGRVYIIKDSTGSAATNNITVTTVGGAVNIDGATTFVMNSAYESVNVIFNGTSYEIW